MNAIRTKLKHGFGKTKKSVQRPTTGHPSVSASVSKPEKSLAEESRLPAYRQSRKTKRATERPPSEASGGESIVGVGNMDRRRTKKKSAFKHRKKTKLSTSPSFAHDDPPAKEDRHSSVSRGAHTCDSLHDGRVVMHTNFGINIDQLFKLLFTPSEFFKDFQARRNTTELQMGEWKASKDGQRNRILRMTLAMQVNIGPKTAKIVEEQCLRKCSHRGDLYSIDVTSTHEGIPYADVFNILIHYCLNGIPNNNTEMIVYATVNYIKPTWAVIKTFINKHSLEGLSIYFCELQEEILKEIAKSKRNSNYKA